MDQYLKWEQLMLMQQLNCVCNTLAKKSITTAIIDEYHDRQSQLLPKEDVALVIWGTKITGDIHPLCGSIQVKRWQENIWQLAKRTSGHTNVLTQWTGNTWTLLSRTRPICIGYGGQNSIQASVAQGSRLAATRAIFLRTKDAQIAVGKRLLHISCSALTTTAPAYWLRTWMN